MKVFTPAHLASVYFLLVHTCSAHQVRYGLIATHIAGVGIDININYDTKYMLYN